MVPCGLVRSLRACVLAFVIGPSAGIGGPSISLSAHDPELAADGRAGEAGPGSDFHSQPNAGVIWISSRHISAPMTGVEQPAPDMALTCFSMRFRFGRGRIA